MNWEAVSAIGEALGAIAVLATLIYLSLQIRQNSQLARMQMNINGLDAFSRYRQLSNSNPEVAVKMQNGEPLSETEKVISQNILSEGLFAAATGYESSKVVDPSRTESFVSVGAVILERYRQPFQPLDFWLENAGYAEFVAKLRAKL